MTNTSIQAIYIAISVMLFSIGLAYTVSTITQASAEFNQVQEHERSPYIKKTEIPEEILLTGAQVIGSLYKLSFDEVTVNINGVVLENAKEFSEKQDYILLNANYKQTFDFNNDGSINTIYYTIH